MDIYFYIQLQKMYMVVSYWCYRYNTDTETPRPCNICDTFADGLWDGESRHLVEGAAAGGAGFELGESAGCQGPDQEDQVP